MATEDGAPEETREILDKLLTEAFFRPERLPGLQSLFEKVSDDCVDRVSLLSLVPSQYALKGVNTAIVGRVFDVHEGTGVWVVVDVPEWNARLLFAFDLKAVSIILEIFLAGDGTEPPYPLEPPLSPVCLGIVKIFSEYVVASLVDGFSKLTNTTMHIAEVTGKIQPDCLGGAGTPVVVADYGLSAMGNDGTFSVIIPKSALSPMRKAFEETGAGKGVSSPGWERQLHNEITKTSVTLTAVLDEGTATLSEVANLKVGQVVPLSITPDSRVQVQANEEPILLCHFGQVDGAYTLRVDEFIDQKQQFIDGIMQQ